MTSFFKKLLLLLITLLGAFCLLFLYMSSSALGAAAKYMINHYTEADAIRDSSLTLMTFNLGYLSGMTNNRSIKREKVYFDNNLQQAVELVSSPSIDIVGLQEIDFGASRSFSINQMDTLAIKGGFAMGYKSINWDKNYVPFPYWPPSNHFGKMLSGQAILSKLPIGTSETVVLPPNEEAPFHYQAFYLDRLLQISEIEFLGKKVKVMNLHIEAFDHETRLSQIEEVKEIYDSYAATQPVILMGDFNSEIPQLTAKKDAIEILMQGKEIASAIPFNEEENNRTFSSEDPMRMIDYIFYNRNFLVCDSARVINEVGQVSDHLPVWAQLSLRATE